MDKKQLESLLDPAGYGEITSTVQLRQTHVSFLFFTDSHVYKIKKEVDFGFLNFMSLDRRRFYCEEEVRLNRRLCPDLYLGVVEVREAGGRLSFRGAGKVVEYAVKMRRLPEERMLHRLLEHGGVTEADVRRIARTIGEFHLVAERSREIDAYGDIDTIRRNWEENFRQADQFIPLCLEAEDRGIVQRWVERFMGENADRFAKRVEGGCIRDCDGDIHSENICLDDKVYIFDCIEFNPRFRYSDTAADIAFLLMDMEFHGRRDLAECVLDEYCRSTGDTGSVGVLDFYLAYRAFVRGKVTAFRTLDPVIPEDEKEAAVVMARRYFRLARGYVIRGSLSPSIIVFCGLMGTGKSTLARQLSFELGTGTLVSDSIRKELAGLSPTERCREEYNQGIYSGSFTRDTYEEIFRRMEKMSGAGLSVVADASFFRREDRSRVREIAAKTGADCVFVHVACDEETMRRRLTARLGDPAAISDGNWELLLRQRVDFEPLSPGEGTWIEVDTSTLPPSETVNCILRHLGVL
ncbi:MAG: AAA family ATPase [Geobacteraceae bacterium]|nr:AAA family ATPase [Geobacteraceae bacterium]